MLLLAYTALQGEAEIDYLLDDYEFCFLYINNKGNFFLFLNRKSVFEDSGRKGRQLQMLIPCGKAKNFRFWCFDAKHLILVSVIFAP